MQILGKLRHLVQQHARFYAKYQINPFARININSDINLNVRCADVHEHPNCDVLLVELCGEKTAEKAKYDLRISEDAKFVDLVVNNIPDATKDQVVCVLKVPLRAELHISSKASVNVAQIYSEEISVLAEYNIDIEGLKARKIQLRSENGNICSKGLLLGKNTDITAKGEGHIKLDKLQGDMLHCSSQAGDISINSCYVEQSKFETKTGNLQLKNVHKHTEVIVHQEGHLNMSGVHGNMFVRTNGGTLNLQLSELEGESIVIGENLRDAQIHISDAIEENTNIEISSSPVSLDESLAHLAECVTPEKHTFELARAGETDQKLLVVIKGGVKLGKLSWADNLMATMAKAEKP